MPAFFAKELEDEQDFGPHPIRTPFPCDALDFSCIGQSAHPIRTLDGETHLVVCGDVVDDARAPKENALREELTDAAQPADLGERALDRKAPQAFPVKGSVERGLRDAAKTSEPLGVQSTRGDQLA